MKKTVGKLLLLLLGICVLRAEILMADEAPQMMDAKAIPGKKQKALMLLSKDQKRFKRREISLPIIKTDMTISYTAVKPSNIPQPPVGEDKSWTGDYWQLMILTPDGKVIKDKKNGPIDMQDPTSGNLKFKVKGPLKAGVYTIIAYVLSRSTQTPIDTTLLAQNVSIRTSNGKDFLTVPPGFFAGSTSSVFANDTAQVLYSLMTPKLD